VPIPRPPFIRTNSRPIHAYLTAISLNLYYLNICSKVNLTSALGRTWSYAEGLISVAPIPRDFNPITTKRTRLISKIRPLSSMPLRGDHKVHAHPISAHCKRSPVTSRPFTIASPNTRHDKVIF